MKKLVIGVMLIMVLIATTSNATNMVINPSFETSETTSGGWPSAYSDWGGDYSAIVGSSNGITPFQGTKMLQWKGCTFNGANTGASSEMAQLIDITSYKGLVLTGQAIVTASVYVNRVQGDSQTDTKFGITIDAFQDGGANPQTLWPYDTLVGSAEGVLFSDSNPATWELITVQLSLPVTTDYLRLMLRAYENIYNENSYPEFDGHYTDAVSLQIIPEPATLLLLGIGGLVLRRKKH